MAVLSDSNVKQRFGLTASDQTWQTAPSTQNPTTQLIWDKFVLTFIDSPTQGRRLQSPRAKVEREIHNGREFLLRLRGEYRAVP